MVMTLALAFHPFCLFLSSGLLPLVGTSDDVEYERLEEDLATPRLVR